MASSSTNDTPADAPPSYAQATGSSARSHQTRNGIPPEHRRSMEDEIRPLPTGWIRQFDPASEHQFFVDTTKEPPRSIWHHPYDDDEYLATLSAEERQHVTRLHRSVSLKDIEAESSDDEAGPSTRKVQTTAPPAPKSGDATKLSGTASAPPGPPTAGDDHPSAVKKFGRRLKDRITHTTHEDRERERQKRAREEEEAYRLHLAFRQALSRAIQTGHPQYLGKDKSGREMWIEPPSGPVPLGATRVPGGALGYNPYNQGPYANPNTRFLRPDYPYQRPYGYGYGGGFGLPIMGGLLGGALLGGLLF